MTTALLLWPSAALASDLARTLDFIQGTMGDESIAGLEEFLEDDPTEALPIILARSIDPGDEPMFTPASARLSEHLEGMDITRYAEPSGIAVVVPRREEARPERPRPAPHFATLGPTRLDYGALQPFITEAAELTRLPAALIDAVIRTESGYRPTAVSRVGAQGLMQLMPATAASLGVTDAFDPRQNIIGGATYLRRMYDRFGSMRLAIAAYNAGPGAVSKHDGVPPYRETRAYVKTVLRRFERSPLR